MGFLEKVRSQAEQTPPPPGGSVPSPPPLSPPGSLPQDGPALGAP